MHLFVTKENQTAMDKKPFAVTRERLLRLNIQPAYPGNHTRQTLNKSSFYGVTALATKVSEFI